MQQISNYNTKTAALQPTATRKFKGQEAVLLVHGLSCWDLAFHRRLNRLLGCQQSVRCNRLQDTGRCPEWRDAPKDGFMLEASFVVSLIVSGHARAQVLDSCGPVALASTEE